MRRIRICMTAATLALLLCLVMFPFNVYGAAASEPASTGDQSDVQETSAPSDTPDTGETATDSPAPAEARADGTPEPAQTPSTAETSPAAETETTHETPAAEAPSEATATEDAAFVYDGTIGGKSITLDLLKETLASLKDVSPVEALDYVNEILTMAEYLRRYDGDEPLTEHMNAVLEVDRLYRLVTFTDEPEILVGDGFPFESISVDGASLTETDEGTGLAISVEPSETTDDMLESIHEQLPIGVSISSEPVTIDISMLSVPDGASPETVTGWGDQLSSSTAQIEVIQPATPLLVMLPVPSGFTEADTLYVMHSHLDETSGTTVHTLLQTTLNGDGTFSVTLTGLSDITLLGAAPSTPTYTILIPSVVEMGDLSATTDSSADFTIEMTGAELYGGSVTVSLSSYTALTCGEDTISFELYNVTNTEDPVRVSRLQGYSPTFCTFDGTEESSTETGRITVNSEDVIGAGVYTGLIVFDCEYTAAP